MQVIALILRGLLKKLNKYFKLNAFLPQTLVTDRVIKNKLNKYH